jgi:hypothetical protein
VQVPVHPKQNAQKRVQLPVVPEFLLVFIAAEFLPGPGRPEETVTTLEETASTAKRG